MRVIKNGYERKFVCPKCTSIILFDMQKDTKKILTHTDGTIYFQCPVCGKSNIITPAPDNNEETNK